MKTQLPIAIEPCPNPDCSVPLRVERLPREECEYKNADGIWTVAEWGLFHGENDPINLVHAARTRDELYELWEEYGGRCMADGRGTWMRNGSDR